MSSSFTARCLGLSIMGVVGCASPRPARESAPARPALAAHAPRAAATPTATPTAFPALVTKDLNGVTQRLPHGLPGEVKLFLIAYQREQQQDIDPWLTLGLRLERVHPGFRVYELPTLSAKWGAAASYIDGGMRRGIREVEARARTLTLYLDKDAFNQALALPTEQQVYALLVDARGHVVWRRDGQFDEAAGAEMTAAIADRLGARQP